MRDRRSDVEGALTELAYAAVGFAVLGIQRAQVARRRIEAIGPVRLAACVASRLVGEARTAFGRAEGA